jgi:acetoacetate decarboxylase
VLTAFYRTDPAAVDQLLQPPLESLGATALIQVAHMPDCDYLGSVEECNVMVGVRLQRGQESIRGGFTPYLFLDSDGGLAHGREVHGQPKKLATVRLETRGDLLVGTVERNGIAIITITLPYKHRVAAMDDMKAYFDFTENINFKAIPHIDGRPAIRQLTARRLADLAVRECWTGPCTVELRPNAQAPVWRLPVVEPLSGFYWSGDFTLVSGRVIHDYLAGAGEGAS